jgi:hypothetical protein
MTYRGKVRDGIIELESGVELPEGATVRIELEPEGTSSTNMTPGTDSLVRPRESLFGIPPHDGGALLKAWTREELMDEMLDP